MNRLSAPAHASILIFLLSSIGLIVLPHFYNLPAPLLAFFYVLLIWRFVGIWRPNWLPNKLVVFLLTVGGIALLYFQHHNFFVLGRNGGTTLFVIALGLKLMELHKERDLYLVTYLAFVVAASQFLFQQNILMAGYIVLVCCTLLATLVCLNSHQPNTGVALKTAAMILLQAVPLAAVIFVLFPRLEAPHWMLFNDDKQAKMGLSDSMELGSISDLARSDELVFRVTFNGAIPPANQRYWRGPVLTHTDGKRWTQGGYRPLNAKPHVSGTAYSYTILMEAQEKNWVFALDIATQFPNSLQQISNYQLLSTIETNKRNEYKITSYTDYNTGMISERQYQYSTRLPQPPSERVKQLVRQLHGFDSSPQQFIKNLLQHFRHEKFYYTLSPPLMLDNPIETFLFETRYGFCSHYAAAFTYLMRVAQIPARVVMGYQGGELNKLGNFLEIRQSDAHAWSEVWLENKGWVRFDPTAAIAQERIEEGNYETMISSEGLISFNATPSELSNWLKTMQQAWRSVDYRWQSWVINYNSANQAKFLANFFGIRTIENMLRVLMIGVAIIGAIAGLFLLRQKRKTTDKVLRLYHRYNKKLERLGVIRASHEGATDFAQRAQAQLPQHAPQIAEISDLFVALRYGKQPPLQDVKKLKQLIAGFKV